MGDNQRRATRKPLQVEFRGKDSEGVGQLFFEGEDLSTGGAFLKSELLFEVGDRLSLEFQLPGGTRVLRVQSQVVWVRSFPRGDEAGGMGVQFVGTNDEDSRTLNLFLGT